MTSLNRVYLAGNLTRDPEVRRTPTGTAVTEFGLAINEKYRDKSGEMAEKTCFVDIVVWARQAETCSEYLSKGSPVLIEGQLQLDRWETDSGEKRSRMRVRASRVQFLSSPRRAEYGDAPPPRAEDEQGASPNESQASAQASPTVGEDDADDLPF